ncbi:hypothetical protein IGS68_00650 [Skermanella sp. TT6]|uniref:Uncharacterized protein n=1 Tax=Skermanella cutis TaxID=2775420 RepID=A0ABX7B6R1_9PROT|nr:hypothetical protein [Skermanella sp. TT6]QQP89824.1 hypothetical protein IGS68_00650 [Skermanella sp. TT6]
MDSKEICLKILAANSEAAVQGIIDSVPEMNNQKNWRPLNGRETNFNIVSNQASTGGKALTELMTNMVDAVLMKLAYQQGVDPKSVSAPQTMYEAVDRLAGFIGLRGGRIVDVDDEKDLRKFAEKNLIIGVTGAKSAKHGRPCYTFVDNGEGQAPKDFERTFLSLSEGNKKDIPFVQGKYNMGSSGVLTYCGKRWFKLIVSRRYDGETGWGWTLLRKRPVGGMPIVDYFVLPGGAIPEFKADMLVPFTTASGKKYDKVILKTGTVVKLYDYEIGHQYMSMKGSREALNENLTETILPFRILDFRWTARTAETQAKAEARGSDRAMGVDVRRFYGMEYLLLRKHAETDIVDDDEAAEAAGDPRQAVGTVRDPELGTIEISFIPLKRGRLPEWLAKTNYRVFHAVNGQVQYKQTRGFISQSCGFPALKDRAAVIVDASNLNFEAHNDIWKGDRENIRENGVGQRYKEEVQKAISESEALSKFQNEVARQEMEASVAAGQRSLLQKLIDVDKNLANLLDAKAPKPFVHLLSTGGENGGEVGKGKFEGKPSPTFIRLEEKRKSGVIDIPINRTRLVAARTDAENGYFQRANNPGQLLLDDKVLKSFGIREHLQDGRLTLYFRPVEDEVEVGQTFKFKMGLKDNWMPELVEADMEIRIVDEEASTAKPKTTNSEAKKAGEGGDSNASGSGKPAPTHGLPPFRLMTHDGRSIAGEVTEAWPNGFSDQDGGIAVDLGESGVLYKINYDNYYHLTYRRQARGDVAKEVVTQKYVLGMLILMLGCENAMQAMGANAAAAEYADQFRQMVARGASSTVLALADNLPKIIDAKSVQATVEVE